MKSRYYIKICDDVWFIWPQFSDTVHFLKCIQFKFNLLLLACSFEFLSKYWYTFYYISFKISDKGQNRMSKTITTRHRSIFRIWTHHWSKGGKNVWKLFPSGGIQIRGLVEFRVPLVASHILPCQLVLLFPAYSKFLPGIFCCGKLWEWKEMPWRMKQTMTNEMRKKEKKKPVNVGFWEERIKNVFHLCCDMPTSSFTPTPKRL